MNILDFTKKVESLTDFAEQCKVEQRLLPRCYTPSVELAKEVAKHEQEMAQQRILKIGIIGRVKAGKSSLLNMIFFDGRDVLPKAVTPMTATLTCLRYGEKYRAEIDCFSTEDIALMREKAKEVKELLINRIEEIKHELLEKNKTSRRKIDESEIPERAEKKAKSEFKESSDFSVYEQVEAFKKAEKPNELIINANSQDDLMHKLADYVGADGKYTAYTKSVTLYLPEDGLKGIEVVDTPGVNDPVQSREAVTNKFLENCHVVLAILPTQNFAQDEEYKFIDKTMKAGHVADCYLIGSRFDGNLLDAVTSEKMEAFALVKKQKEGLIDRANKVFSKIQNINFNRMVFSSSIAFILLKNINDIEACNSYDKKQWENLSSAFPETFSKKSEAERFLNEITGKDKIHQIIKEIADDKDQKLAVYDRNFENQYKNKLKEYLSNVDKYAEQEIKKLETVDVNQLQAEKTTIEKMSQDIKSISNKAFKDSVTNFSSSLKEKLVRKNKDIFRSFNAEQGRETKTETYTYTEKVERKQSGFIGGAKRFFGRVTNNSDWGYYTDEVRREGTRTIKVLITTGVCVDIKDIHKEIEENLSILAHENRAAWQDDICEKIRSELNKLNTSKDAKEKLPQKEVIDNMIKNIISMLPMISFKLLPIPELFTKHVSLREEEGNEFVRKAKEYVQTLEQAVYEKIESYVQEYSQILAKQDVGKELTQALKQALSNTLEQLGDKENSIKNFREMSSKAKGLLVEIN